MVRVYDIVRTVVLVASTRLQEMLHQCCLFNLVVTHSVHMHTRTHTHTHTHTHTDTLNTEELGEALKFLNDNIQLMPRDFQCAYTYTRIHAQTYTHTHTHARTCTHTRTHAHTHTHARTHARTHTHTHTTHTQHTHTHTHTHRQKVSQEKAACSA